MSFTINTTQLDALSAKIKAFGQQVQQEVALEGVASMAKVVYDEARLNAERNKKSGLLQSAIYRAYSPEKSGDNLKTYRISWNKRKAPHGHLIEFGTAKSPAYPFLRPSLSKVPAAIEAGKARMAAKLAELEGTL